MSALSRRLLPRRRSTWILVLVLAWAFAARVWFATPELNDKRYWDERYGLENIRALVDRGQVRPANGYHPSLSYLPQAAVLAVPDAWYDQTGDPSFKIFEGKGVTPLGYLLCRLVQVLFGLGTLILVYWMGRRMASPEVGVAAAFVLAVSPWHLRQSVIYKPDILLLLTVELAFLAALWALKKPSLRRYLWAGGAVGLALASKFNAGPIALPLALGTWLQGWNDRRRWLWLIIAGVTAAVVFLALNPFVLMEPGLYQEDFSRTLRDYERKAMAEQSSRLGLLVHAGSSLLETTFHGPWVGALALAGLLYLLWRGLLLKGVGSPTFREDRDRALVFLAFPVSYVLFYVLVTTNPSAHNWLPLLPFTSVAAAMAGVEGARRLAAFLPPRWAGPSLATAACVVAAVLLAPPNRFVYRAAVPTTMDVAERFLQEALDPLAGRVVAYEESLERPSLRGDGSGTARAVPVADFSSLSPQELDIYDAVVVSQERFGGGDLSTFGGGASAGEVKLLPRQPFRARGPALAVLARPWSLRSSFERIGETEATEGPRSVTLSLPERSGTGLISFEIWLPNLPSRAPAPVVTIGDETVPLLRARRNRFLVPRLRIPAEAPSIQIAWSDAPPRCRRVLLSGHVWDRPRGAERVESADDLEIMGKSLMLSAAKNALIPAQ